MIERCPYCGFLVSAFPCKECGYEPVVPDECPRFRKGLCISTKKLCPNKRNYMNCEVFDED